MSGQDGIRGYYFQTIASVISSFNKRLWDYCCVEPNTDKDKVDVIFYQSNAIILCQQIKSSKGNFLKPDIGRWIQEMAKDVSGAKQYELILIGTVSSGGKDYINSINQMKETIGAEPLPIKITSWLFDVETLESRIRDNLHSFFSAQGYLINHNNIELMAGALLSQFFQFSIIGQKFSYEEFRNKLLEWAKSNYPKFLVNRQGESDIQVYIYDKIDSKFVLEYESKKSNLNMFSYLEQLAEDILIVYKKAERLKLPKRTTDDVQETLKGIAGAMSQITSFQSPSLRDADFASKDLSVVKIHFDQYFGLSLSDDFFQVGNLKEHFSSMGGNAYVGTQMEKEKGELLDDFYFKLRTFVQLKEFCASIEVFYCLPMVAANQGDHHDEEITVRLDFPAGVEILTVNDINIPDDEDALDCLIENDILSQFFGMKKDGHIESYPQLPLPYAPGLEHMELMDRVTNGNSVRDFKRTKLKRQLENYLGVSIIKNDITGLLLEVEFQAIIPNITMAFPGILFFKSDKDFAIKYRVTSKYSGKVRSGTLSIKVLDNNHQV